MQVVFITHNELGQVCIEQLSKLGADVQAVYTKPKSSDISDQVDLKPTTETYDIPLDRVESVNTGAVKSEIKEIEPELLFVIGWSQLVDSEILCLSSVASLGMHPAPLPRGRGRAPLAWSIIKGLDQTALSFFHLTEEPDAGDIVGQESISIKKEDDASTLYNKVIDAGKTLIQQYYPEFESGNIPRKPQDDSKATWWPKREPHHGLINWNKTSTEVYDWIRGQTRPYPGAFSYIGDTKVTVWSARPSEKEYICAAPGKIIQVREDSLEIATWESTIEITEVQVQGDDPIQASELVKKYPFEIGDTFVNARDKIQR